MRSRRVALLLALPVLLALLVALLIQVLAAAPPPVATAMPAPDEGPPPAALPIRVAPQDPSAQPDSRPGTFEGRVLSSATIAPIAGADLTFSRGGAADSVRSDPEGAFLFRPPTTGRWLLAAVAAQGYFPFAPEWGFSPVQLEAAAGRHVRGIEVFLTPAAELTGLVVDEDGEPVPGAEVQILGAGASAALITIPSRFVTGADGTFRAAAPQGSILEASKPGYYPGHAQVDLMAMVEGHVRIIVAIGPAGARSPRAPLAGRVVTHDGRPIAGALVEAAKTHGWAYSGAPVAQPPHRRGRPLPVHRAGPVPAPDHGTGGGPRERPRLAGVARRRGRDHHAAARRQAPRLRARRAVGRAGRPFHGACVLQPGLVPRQPRPGRLGGKPLGLLPAGGGGAGAQHGRHPGSAPGRLPLQAMEVPPPPGEAQLDVALASGDTLTGVVRDEDTREPLAGAWVKAEATVDDYGAPVTTLGETTTRADGTFTLSGLPGLVRLIVNAEGHHQRSSGVVKVAATERLFLDLRRQRPDDPGPVDPVGIGAVLVASADSVVVGALRPGHGADSGSLVPGDELLEIDGHAVADLGLGGAVEAMRGAEGTSVFLQVRRGNLTLDVEVPRQRRR